MNRLISAKYIALILLLLPIFWSCGDPPAAPPADQVGSIEVLSFYVLDTATPDTAYPQVMNITLDDDSLGYFSNPNVLNDVVAGLHRLQIVAWDSVNADSVGKFDTIRVSDGGFEQVEFTLASMVAPGNPAPFFEIFDYDSNLIAIDSFNGQVLLLYLFEFS